MKWSQFKDPLCYLCLLIFSSTPVNPNTPVMTESDIESDCENTGDTYNTDSDTKKLNTGYSLRQRPSPASLHSRLNHRPAHVNTLKDYRNMDVEPESTDTTPAKKLSNRPDATPSQTCMNAQKQITKYHELNGKPTPGPRPVPKRFITKNLAVTPQKTINPIRTKLVPEVTTVENPLPDATMNKDDGYQSDDTVLYYTDTDNNGTKASPNIGKGSLDH